jgi:transglutaminase-like putative cysteine protease/tetratricopeptide (TPR) repeat protein
MCEFGVAPQLSPHCEDDGAEDCGVRGMVLSGMKLCRNVALLLAVFGISLSSQAQENPSAPWDGKAFAASPQEVLKASAAMPAPKQVDVTVLLDERRISFDKDRKATETHHLVYRIETQGGMEDWTAVGSRWSPWYQERPTVEARVIAPDGRVSTLDPKTLSDAPVHRDTPDTYNDDRDYQGPLPGLTPGAIVEELIVVKDTTAFFNAGSVYREYFDRPFPVVTTRMVVESPESLGVRYKVRKMADVEAQKETRDGVVTLTFEKDNMDPSDPLEVNLPADVAPVAEISITTGSSWKDVADRYRDMSDPQVRPQETASMLPAMASGASRDEKITAIVSDLHRSVRYTGIEFGEAKLTPQPPSETLKRHYGDCKDKATLLVSMLRQAGIPANLALLSIGPGQDVDPGLPGMQLFDHAIVFVPGTASSGKQSSGQDLWIDATAEYARVGDLPPADRGRWALIIREGTTGLTKTPESKPSDNMLIEKREFTLAENGPAKVEEKSETHGAIDEIYRAQFGGPESKQEREELEGYVKAVYAAEKLDSLQHTDGSDLSKPFQLDLVADKAKRGYSGLEDAVVAVPTGALLNRLPQWFFKEPPGINKNSAMPEEKPRAEDFVFEPFVTSWDYTVKLPQGFQSRALPEDKTENLGPAVMSTKYSVNSDGVVRAVFKFDSVKGRYTPEEAMALRRAIYDRRTMEPVLLRFEEVGAAQMSAGKVKEALATYHALVTLHPREGLHHVQLAIALVNAGAGDAARSEAQLAAKLEPDSALVYRSLGEVLQYDSIGREFAPGFDRAGAIAAYKKSLEIEPDDAPTRFSLAVLNEFNDRGERYGEGADFDAAVVQYRDAKKRNPELNGDYDLNPLFDLFYAKHYQQALDAAHGLNASVSRNSVAIASAAAMHGAKAGVEEAQIDAQDNSGRSQALGRAGMLLVRQRQYPVAAALLESGVGDSDDAALRSRQVEIFKTLEPYEKTMLPASDPRSAVQRMLIALMEDTLTQKTLESVFSTQTLKTDKQRKKILKDFDSGAGQIRQSAQDEGLTPQVLSDVMMGSMHYALEGDDGTGYRITTTSMGAGSHDYYVVKESAGYRVLTNDFPGEDNGNEIVALLDQNKADAARQWLDWSREAMKRDGDDPLGGPLLPRFWTVGDKADVGKMRLAALAMLSGTDSMGPHVAELERAAKGAQNIEERTSLDLALAVSYNQAQRWKDLRPVADRLMAGAPRSSTAVLYVTMAEAQLKDMDALRKTAAEVLKNNPEDDAMLRVLSESFGMAYDYAQAKAYVKKLQDEGKATANDLNSLAWLSLFDPPVNNDAIQAAQQANLLTKSGTFAILHTLACLYAETGQTKQARELLLQGMRSEAMEKPDSAVWYVFGRVYQDYGLPAAAAAAYARVEKPEDAAFTAEDTYVLAQKRLDELGPSAAKTEVAAK